MARRQVIEIVCSRCKRGEIQTEKELEGIDPNVPEFAITLHKKKVVYDDLCVKCRKSLMSYFQRVTKTEERSANKEGQKPEVQKKGGLLSIGRK